MPGDVLSVKTPVLVILASLFIVFQLTQRKEQFGYEYSSWMKVTCEALLEGMLKTLP